LHVHADELLTWVLGGDVETDIVLGQVTIGCEDFVFDGVIPRL